MRISDWSSDVCSSDLLLALLVALALGDVADDADEPHGSTGGIADDASPYVDPAKLLVHRANNTILHIKILAARNGSINGSIECGEIVWVNDRRVALARHAQVGRQTKDLAEDVRDFGIIPHVVPEIGRAHV